MAIKGNISDVETEFLRQLEEIESDEDINLMTEDGRIRYVQRMSEIQAALELMQRVLMKQGLEGGFIQETTEVLKEIEEMQPSENMGLVPSWFVDKRTGNPAIFVFPTTPSDALGEGKVQDVYAPNGAWFSRAPMFHISGILARVYPLPNYQTQEIVPTPVWQVYDCTWISRLNAQALHLYRFDEAQAFGKNKSGAIEVDAKADEPVLYKTKKEAMEHIKEGDEVIKVGTKWRIKTVADQALESMIKTGKAASPSKLQEIIRDKYTPEKYFEDIKVTVDAFKCNEVFFLLQTLQVRYVAVFSQLVKRIYGEQLLREMTIAAALEEYLNMRKGFGDSIAEGWKGRLSDTILAIIIIGLFAIGGIFLLGLILSAASAGTTTTTGIILSIVKALGGF